MPRSRRGGVSGAQLRALMSTRPSYHDESRGGRCSGAMRACTYIDHAGDMVLCLGNVAQHTHTRVGPFGLIRVQIKSKNVIGITVSRMGRMQDVPCR